MKRRGEDENGMLCKGGFDRIFREVMVGWRSVLDLESVKAQERAGKERERGVEPRASRRREETEEREKEKERAGWASPANNTTAVEQVVVQLVEVVVMLGASAVVEEEKFAACWKTWQLWHCFLLPSFFTTSTLSCLFSTRLAPEK